MADHTHDRTKPTDQEYKGPDDKGPDDDGLDDADLQEMMRDSVMGFMPEFMPEQEVIDPKDYLINYNERFGGERTPLLFRDEVIRQTLSCLIGRSKPNALLIGAAGVGKTMIVEEIAGRLASGDPSIPECLAGYTIWELPISNIVSGSGLVGNLEKKARAILDFAQNPGNKVILFIDEIHTLMDGGQSYERISQIMKPALARGNMKVIGATTLQESQRLIRDPAFQRRFTRLIVDELSIAQTREILRKERDTLGAHYHNRIEVSDDVLDEVLTAAEEYRTVCAHRPDHAITLLDRAMADACIDSMAGGGGRPYPLTTERVRSTARKLMMGNNQRAETDPALLKQNLKQLHGQDDIIEHLVDVVRRDALNVFPRKRPITMLFAGDSGVGKSEAVKILARTITGSEPVMLNMTEFSEPSSISRIVGAHAGYVGYDSKAELPFDMLESNPYQVVLLDEFEKADRSVQRLFMSAFDEGYFKTARGKVVDFSKSIIIATTNAGYTTRGNTIGFSADGDNRMDASVRDLSQFFDMELLNRFGCILRFGPITENIYREILRDTYEREVRRIRQDHGAYPMLDETLSDETVDQLLAESHIQGFGARPVHGAVRRYIEDTILAYHGESSIR